MKWTALHFEGHVDVAKVLIQNGADVNAVDKDKWRRHFTTQLNGHVDVVKVLIQNGADVNAVDKRQMDGTSHSQLQKWTC